MKKPLILLLIVILIIGAVPALTFALGESAGETASTVEGPVLSSPGTEGLRGANSSEKEITAVILLSSTKSVIAKGTLSGDTWTITLPSDTDQDLIKKIGASADVFMRIEYKGASLKQKDGYDDAGQDSWASGNILCGISVNSQQTFTVTAEDGSTRAYTITIVVDESQGEEVPALYHISVSTPPGGTLSPDVTDAKEGDSVIVTATPNDGYRMVDGSMAYTLNVAGGSTVAITGNRFQMPNCDVTITCQWEQIPSDDSSGQETEEPVKGIIGFVIGSRWGYIQQSGDGIYTISVYLPFGSDVTALTPTINVSAGVSITPVSGVTRDFTQPVTYTAKLPDGTVLKYTVTVIVEEGSPADRMWHEITDPENQTPWWEYADEQKEEGDYPKYW